MTAHATESHSSSVLNSLWPGDDAAGLILKAASNPATTTTSGWASSLAPTAVADFLLGLGGSSAGSTLLRRGLQLEFGDSNAIRVPGVIASATGVGFVKQSDPIAVRQLALSGPTLTSKKLSSVSVLTRETFEHSTPTIESLVSAALGEGISLALDAALFANTPGDEVTPEGLLYNVVPLSASSAAAKTDAIIEDLQALVAAVAPIAGNVPIIIVASPAQYVAARLVLRGNPGFDIFSSSALAAGTLVAIAPNALASAIDSTPRFDVSTQGVLHMEDATPAQFATSGMPNVVSAPLRSLYQTNCIGGTSYM